jgi:hypothetical protein
MNNNYKKQLEKIEAQYQKQHQKAADVFFEQINPKVKDLMRIIKDKGDTKPEDKWLVQSMAEWVLAGLINWDTDKIANQVDTGDE